MFKILIFFIPLVLFSKIDNNFLGCGKLLLGLVEWTVVTNPNRSNWCALPNDDEFDIILNGKSCQMVNFLHTRRNLSNLIDKSYVLFDLFFRGMPFLIWEMGLKFVTTYNLVSCIELVELFGGS